MLEPHRHTRNLEITRVPGSVLQSTEVQNEDVGTGKAVHHRAKECISVLRLPSLEHTVLEYSGTVQQDPDLKR